MFQYTKPRNVFSFICIAVSLIFIGYIIGYNMTSRKDSETPKSNETELGFSKEDMERFSISNQSNDIEDESQTTSGYNEKFTTFNNTILRFVTFYEKCGNMFEEKKLVAHDEIGLTRKQLADLYYPWIIEKFSLHEVVLKKTVFNYCPKHYILRDDNGYITILQPNSDNEGFFVFQQTQIRVDWLPEEVQKCIQYDYIAISLEELEGIFEDFES